MLSRLLNIWVIKQRLKPNHGPPAPPSEGSGDAQDPADDSTAAMSRRYAKNRLTEYVVSLGDGKSSVRLRGTPDDLRAITATAWLRSKTHFEGYLEAAAKLIVFLVAALSGNMTQAGAVIMMVLLLVTAGLLALSNAHAKSFRVNGRVGAPQMPGHSGNGRVPDGKLPPADSGGQNGGKHTSGDSCPSSSALGGFTSSDEIGFSSSHGTCDDMAEKGQVGYSTEDSWRST